MANKKKGGKKPAAPTPSAKPAAVNTTKSNGNAADGSSKAPSPVSAVPPQSPTPTPSPVPATPVDTVDPKVQAEKTKEQGNAAFKAGKYQDAVDLYTKAIDLNGTEPSYLTNRAASYIALKKFRPALEDCQLALSLQSSSTPPATDAAKVKTLLRLGRCQLALGETAAASSSVRTVLTLEPGNAQAKQLQTKVGAVESHLKNLEDAKKKKNWGMARLSLDKCLQGIEGEGAEVPSDWRVWKIQLELCKANWDAAHIAANDALRLSPNSPDILAARGLVLFLTGKLPQAQQHVTSALRLDPGHEAARRLRVRVKEVERLKDEGNTAFKTGKLEEAIGFYSEALDSIGDAEEEGGGGQIRATLLSNRATTLLKLSRHEEALSDTDASLALSPSSYKALRTRARINVFLEKYDAGVADFKSAIEQAQSDGSTSEAEVRSLKTELKKAEADLKRSKTKDYYKILGVHKECTEVEIKKAYRRESLKHHPDKGGDEEKFKLVVEAHAVLSDPQRRQRYDLGEDEDGGMSGGGGPGGFGMSEEDLANIFMSFGGGGFSFGGGGHGGGGGGRRGHSHGFSF